MSNDKKDAQIKQMLMELKVYIDQLNTTLQSNISKEIINTKTQYKEIITLAGELNDCLTQR